MGKSKNKKGKNIKKNNVKKIISACFAVLIVVVIGVFCATRQPSDELLIKKDWPRISDKHLSFEYPEKIIEIDTSAMDKSEKDIRIFQNTKKDRIMMNVLLDFKGEELSPENYLVTVVMSSLESMDATDIEWIDPLMYSGVVSSKIKYKIGKKERTGFGLIYASENHYELLILLPNTRDYSADYLERVIQSINIVE